MNTITLNLSDLQRYIALCAEIEADAIKAADFAEESHRRVLDSARLALAAKANATSVRQGLEYLIEQAATMTDVKARFERTAP